MAGRFTVAAGDRFVVHLPGCSHLRRADGVLELEAAAPRAADLLAAVDRVGTYREEGTWIESAPCLPAALRRDLERLQREA